MIEYTQKDTGCVLRARYDSVHDFIESINDGKEVKNKGNKNYFIENTNGMYGDLSWYGLKENEVKSPSVTLQNISELGKSGWQRGCSEIKSLMSKIERPALPSVRRKRVWSDNGDFLDINRVYSGMLDRAWQTTNRSGKHIPRIAIAVDYIASAAESSNRLMWRGAAAGALAMSLIEAGYAVTICVGAKWYATAGESYDVNIITVKNYRSPFTYSDAAFTMALPAFFRMLGTSWEFKHRPENMGAGCGKVGGKLSQDIIPDLGADKVFIFGKNEMDKHQAIAKMQSCVSELKGGRNE